MIEILVVALFCSWVGKTAKNKGRSSGPYIGITLGLWFGLEILGVIIGLSLFDNFLPAYGLGLGGAALGGIIAAVIVSKAQPVSGYMAPGQMPYYPPGQAPYYPPQQGQYPPGQMPYYPPQQGQAPNYPTVQQPYAPASLQQPAAPALAPIPEPLTAPASTPGSIVCPGCATPNRADASFCRQCGTALK
jgi:hypothetical protein